MKALKIIAIFISLWSQHNVLQATEETSTMRPSGKISSLTLISHAQNSNIVRFLASKGIQSEFKKTTIGSTSSEIIPEILKSKKQAPHPVRKKIRGKRKSAHINAHLSPLKDPSINYHTLKKECLFKAEELRESKGIIIVKRVESSPALMEGPCNMPAKGNLLTKKRIESILSSKKKKGKKEKPDPSDNYLTLRKEHLPEYQELKEINKVIVPVLQKNNADK